MKILIVSNLYPPYYVGGYELRCAMVAEGMRQAGHEVRVLTSRYGLGSTGRFRATVKGVRVERVLGQYVYGLQAPAGRPYFLSMVRPQLQDAQHFISALDDFRPDVVNWWSISGLTKAILSIPKLRGIPDVLCVDDTWILEEEARGQLGERPLWAGLWGRGDKPWYWRPVPVWLMERWKARLLKRGIHTAAVPFRPTHVCFVSEFLRDEYKAAGINFLSTEVVHGGVRINSFLSRRWRTAGRKPVVRLLYAGLISRNRGLHTAIEAFGRLSGEAKALATLTVVGAHSDADYFGELQRRVRDLDLSARIRFIGKKNYEEMPAIYQDHDLLIVPSTLREGLPLSMMEAMLAGCAVVTTGSGGAMEIARLADLPLFPKEDALALSRILEDLIHDREKLDGIARRGQEVSMREFSADRMIERFLSTVQNLYEKTRVRAPQGDPILLDDHKVQFVARGRL
jgi:glycogen(starch) synthase